MSSAVRDRSAQLGSGSEIIGGSSSQNELGRPRSWPKISRNEPVCGRTSGPADRSKGCTFNVLPRLTRPAPVLARLATVRQVSPPKTYTASLGRNPVPRHLCSSGEPLSTLCSCLGTLTSRYTPDRPYEGPTRSVGNFGPRYHDCCARPWSQGSN